MRVTSNWLFWKTITPHSTGISLGFAIGCPLRSQPSTTSTDHPSPDTPRAFPGVSSPPEDPSVDLFPQLFARLEMDYAPFWHGNAITISWISPYAQCLSVDGKCAKPTNFDAMPTRNCSACRLQNGGHGHVGITLRELVKPGGHFYNKVRAIHGGPDGSMGSGSELSSSVTDGRFAAGQVRDPIYWFNRSPNWLCSPLGARL
jgi:hypothetical protein